MIRNSALIAVINSASGHFAVSVNLAVRLIQDSQARYIDECSIELTELGATRMARPIQPRGICDPARHIGQAPIEQEFSAALPVFGWQLDAMRG